MSDGWNPGAKYQMYLRKIQEILGDEDRTVRDVYYALEARGFEAELEDESYRRALERHRDDPDEHAHPDVLPKSEWCWEFAYQYVKRAVKKGRRHGYIDPALIIDESRQVEISADTGHESPEAFVDEYVDGVWNVYQENFWAEQDSYVEVWLEKQALASVFRPICNEYNVRLEATRGDWSDSKVYEATQRLLEKIDAGKDVVILYFGDFNPSGFHAPVSIQETMAYYGIKLHRESPTGDNYFDIWPDSSPAAFGDCEGTLLFDRKAINLEQIKQFDLPENPNPSKTDKDKQLRDRFQRHVSEGRDINIELNALKEYHREFLEDLIRNSITEHIDMDAKQETEQRVAEAREAIREAVDIDDTKLER